MANDSGPDKDPQTLPQLQATGAEIFGSDEEKIGDLGEVRDSDFTVTGRGLLKGELNIPVSHVARITADDRVFLDVPADEAKIGVVDRLFTRVGASDNLAGGESTFLVEMNEVANILNNATPQSLVLLDEVGRGTSTYDGLSLAWSIAEYLHQNDQLAAKTLFATHYHELTELEGYLERVKNVNVAVKKFGEKVLFLRKITPGGCDHSYGIDVARLAGLPATVIERAQNILSKLESGSVASESASTTVPSEIKEQPSRQLPLFVPDNGELKEALLKLD